MKRLNLQIFILLFITIFFNLNISAQNNNDSIQNQNYWRIFWKFWSEDYINSEKPFIELDMGYTNPFYHENVFKEKFGKIGLIELKLGFEDLKSYSNSSILQKSESDYFTLQNYNYNLPLSEQKNNELNLEAWRAGLSFRKAYIYNLGSGIKLSLYNTDGFGWTLLKFPDKAILKQDQESIDLFGKDLRFGNQTEGGIKLSLSDHAGVNAGFERTLVYPRYMFWYWTGSEIIYHAGSECINYFVNAVRNSSPEFVPIIYFILRNAWSYAYYELRKEKMNWPFETVPPLMFETYKIGLSFRF